jgi:hypothetical protein
MRLQTQRKLLVMMGVVHIGFRSALAGGNTRLDNGCIEDVQLKLLIWLNNGCMDVFSTKSLT